MAALLLKMNRSMVTLDESAPQAAPTDPAAADGEAPQEAPPMKRERHGRKKKAVSKEDSSAPATAQKTQPAIEDFGTYRAIILARKDKDDVMGGLRVQLSRRNSRDLKFIAACTGVPLTTLLNNIVRHHIKSHAKLLSTLTRPALSWAKRDNTEDHEQ